jgi:chloramphenicol 3-O-phosphotransferase
MLPIVVVTVITVLDVGEEQTEEEEERKYWWLKLWNRNTHNNKYYTSNTDKSVT